MSRLSRHRKFSTYSSMFKKHHFENQKIRNPIYFKDASRLLGNNKATFFAEFNFSTADKTNLKDAIKTTLASNGIDTFNLTFTLSEINDIIKIDVVVTNPNSLTRGKLIMASGNIKLIKDLVNVELEVIFDNNGEIVIANLVNELSSEGEHPNVYHFNQYYQFVDTSGEHMDERGDTSGSILATNRIFKLVNSADISLTNAIASGDEVYLVDISGNYLEENVTEGTNFTFTNFSGNKQLLEVHGYRQNFVTTIATGNYIADNYGFKLEVLPDTGVDKWILYDVSGDEFQFTTNQFHNSSEVFYNGVKYN